MDIEQRLTEVVLIEQGKTKQLESLRNLLQDVISKRKKLQNELVVLDA